MVPTGSQAELSGKSTSTYLEIKEKANRVAQLYLTHGIDLDPQCGLAQLISASQNLSDAWFCNRRLDVVDLVRAGFMQQVADNVLPLAGIPGIARELRRLTSGTLDNLDRNRSIAKNALWELEMLAYVRSCGVSAELAEPPDLMMALPAAEIGVACKRMYSVKNFSKVLSEGVQQINASGHAGLIAVNLDELLPARQMLKLKDADHLGRTLIEFKPRIYEG